MSRQVVPASLLQNLIELAMHGRLNLADLFAEAGIDPDIVGRPDAVLAVDQFDRLFLQAFARLDDPLSGLRAGLSSQYTSLDLLGRLMATSGTLREAIGELLRFKDLVAPYLHFTFREEGEVAVLSCRPDGAVAFAGSAQGDDLVVATIYSIGRALAGENLQVRAVAFRHASPADIAPYSRAFAGASLFFGEHENAIHFAAAALAQPLVTAYPPYHRRVEQQAEQQLSRLAKGQGQGHGMVAQVEAHLESRLGREPIGIADIARLFNMTARTLQRRLAAEGALFGDLRDRVRHRVACRLLADGTVAMAPLAQQLGFADTANFYHAFRRWQGETPGAYRRRQLPPAQA